MTEVDLATLLARVPLGWTLVRYESRPYGLSRRDHADGGAVSVYAEELGGADVVSTNVYRTAAGDVLRPCEMPAEKVLDFLRGWTPDR
ncbi:peptide methionine sulfoxide reductase [uncultured Friedmanniella sp.]|uniref:peptide methionine sulfoxide reductase n=1 Tax=uncultured Friedmanniella sp. TaxID=335381 RepID=UPI0035CB91EB